MKVASFSIAALTVCAGLVHAAEFTGWLADAKCAKAGKAASKEHAGCADKCVNGGEQIILVGEGNKIYKIKNQEKVKPHLGHHVALQATLDGETLDVETGRYLD